MHTSSYCSFSKVSIGQYTEYSCCLSRRNYASSSDLHYGLLLLPIASSQKAASGAPRTAQSAPVESIKPGRARRPGGAGAAAPPARLLAARLAARALRAARLFADLAAATTGCFRTARSRRISDAAATRVRGHKTRPSDPTTTTTAAAATEASFRLSRVWHQSSMCVSFPYLSFTAFKFQAFALFLGIICVMSFWEIILQIDQLLYAYILRISYDNTIRILIRVYSVYCTLYEYTINQLFELDNKFCFDSEVFS